MDDLNSMSGAIIVGPYRYLLWRNWVPDNRRRLLWVMLNPSTADATQDDPTLASCTRLSKRCGYDGLEVVNLFAFRAADPKQLRSTCDPVGIENDEYLQEAAERAAAIMVAWGARGNLQGRDHATLALLKKAHSQQLRCLGRVGNGSPRHPLYVAGETELQDFL